MEPGGDFNFQFLPKFKFNSMQNKDLKDNLMKWSMVDGFSVQAYSFDKPFKKYLEKDFLTDFLACSNVTSTLLKLTSDRKLVPSNSPAESLKYSEVKCTLTTMEIFDKLISNKKIAYEDGRLRKCCPEYVRMEKDGERDGYEIEIFDNLRKLLLSDEEQSEDYADIKDVLSNSDKKEFLVKLFSHFVIGGSLCQYEDYIEPYLSCTKLLYKDIIGVAAAQKEDATGGGGGDCPKLCVISHIYQIHSVRGRGPMEEDIMFQRNYQNNFFYIIVNPFKQTLFTLYHHM